MENNLHVKVSSFISALNRDSKTVFLDSVLADEKYKPLIEKLRSTTDEKKQALLKSKLPCFSPSCIIGEDGQTTHSGIICVDVDFKDNSEVTNFKDFKKQLPKIENVAYASLSARGQGYFLLIAVSNPAKHKEHFKSLELDFARCGIKIDPACSDIKRLRFVSFDDEPYINPNAKPYTFIYSPALIVNDSYPDSPSIDRVSALIDAIEDSLTDITGNYQQWFQIGCALANTFGENPGREFFHRVSCYSDLYENDTTDRQFTTCLKGLKSSTPISINTLFHFAKLNGVLISGPEVDFKLN